MLIAGGRGRRLGLGVPKALATVRGRTLLDRAVEILASVTDEIVLAAPASVELPLPGAGVPLRRVADRAPTECPLAGVVAGLEAGDFDSAIVLGVDFPWMRAAMLASMIARLRSSRAWAVVPAPGGHLQPLAAAYAPAAFGPLRDELESGERSIVRAVSRLAPIVIQDAELSSLDGGLECFFNLNTPTDLLEVERRAASVDS